MKKLALIVISILCVLFIFSNSSKSGEESNIKSKSIVNKIVDKIEEKVENNSIKKININKNKLNLLLRKAAHALEFLMLAILVALVLENFGIKGKNAIIYILFIVLLVGVLDEFYQLYIPGRTSSVRDVLIDFSGGILGTTIFFILRIPLSLKNFNK